MSGQREIHPRTFSASILVQPEKVQKIKVNMKATIPMIFNLVIKLGTVEEIRL